MNKYGLTYPLRGETLINGSLVVVNIKEFDLEKDEFIIDYKDLLLKSENFNSFILPTKVFQDICLVKKSKNKSKAEIIQEVNKVEEN
jgi:hypothetical protein